MPAKKAAKKKVTKKAAKKPAPKKAAAKIPPRADKGEGEAAVQARLKALKEPIRSILAKIHAIVRKSAPTLQPTVKWGFAVYLRDGKMALVAAPRSKHVSFGFTMDAGIKGQPQYVEYTSPDQVSEAEVVSFVKRLG